MPSQDRKGQKDATGPVPGAAVTVTGMETSVKHETDATNTIFGKATTAVASAEAMRFFSVGARFTL